MKSILRLNSLSGVQIALRGHVMESRISLVSWRKEFDLQSCKGKKDSAILKKWIEIMMIWYIIIILALLFTYSGNSSPVSVKFQQKQTSGTTKLPNGNVKDWENAKTHEKTDLIQHMFIFELILKYM